VTPNAANYHPLLIRSEDWRDNINFALVSALVAGAAIRGIRSITGCAKLIDATDAELGNAGGS
jgi:hypothetical protein